MEVIKQIKKNYLEIERFNSINFFFVDRGIIWRLVKKVGVRFGGEVRVGK